MSVETQQAQVVRELLTRENEMRVWGQKLEEQVRQLQVQDQQTRQVCAELEVQSQRAVAAQHRAEQEMRLGTSREHALKTRIQQLEAQKAEGEGREAQLQQKIGSLQQSVLEEKQQQAKLRGALENAQAAAADSQKCYESLNAAFVNAQQELSSSNWRVDQQTTHVATLTVQGQKGQTREKLLEVECERLRTLLLAATEREHELRTSNQRLYQATVDISKPDKTLLALQTSPQRTGR